MFSLFSYVSPCYTLIFMFSSVFTCSTLFSFVSPCFSLFFFCCCCYFSMVSYVFPCFAMFSHVFPCSPLSSPVSPLVFLRNVVANVAVRSRNKEQGTWAKGCAKDGAAWKELGGGGKERKYMLADKPLEFENHPLDPWMRAPTFNAVTNMFGLIGAEVNFQGRVWNENKDSLSKYFVSNARTTGMKKSQWIRTINAVFVIAASKKNLSS